MRSILFAVVLSVAKDLAPVPKSTFSNSARSFAALRMTEEERGSILHTLLV